MTELPPEDVYATAKKIRFVLRRIERYRQGRGLTPRVLDFGCGNGSALSRYLIGEGIDYTGVDFHLPSLNYAREYFGGPRARFLTEVPAGEQFDVLILSEVLEHLVAPGAVLRELSQVLSPGGIVLGSIPNGYGLTEIEKYLDRKLHLYQGLQWFWRRLRAGDPSALRNNSPPYNHESGHVQFFTQREFRRMIAGAGFRIAELRNGSVLGADLSGATYLRPRALIKLNVTLADYIPIWAAATWHFMLVRVARPDG